MKKIVAIVQARMGSERLPGKSLKKICGIPMLEHIINRISTSRKIHNIIIATSNNIKDRPIINLSKKLSIPYYAGSEDDVLERFIGAVESVSTDAEIARETIHESSSGQGSGQDSAQAIVVRICGDNPLIDIGYLDEMIDSHLSKKAEYTYNYSPIPIGTAGEVINYDVLKKLKSIAKDKRYREHVTTYILDHLNEFNVNCTKPPPYLEGRSFRFTVDTEEDLSLIRKIYRRLYSEGKIIETSQAISLLESNHPLSKINIHISQKDWRVK
ncbi:MAG: glycosyltransferase family protein [Nitrospinae bacterium]|nr:glycosyltransferase family protein [Nitrospinota bacterium]